MNAPDLNEWYKLQDGDQKIQIHEKGGNVSNFVFVKEDHTAGNMLRVMLLRNPHVIFAGYRQPHPLTYNIEMTIRTDGTITPKEALDRALLDLIKEIEIMQRSVDNFPVYDED